CGATNIHVTTTSDGLAVFPVSLQASSVGHEVLVAVNFTSQDNQHTCNVSGSQDAFFVPALATPSPTATQQGGPGGGPSTGTPTNPNLTVTPTVGGPQQTPTHGGGGGG